MVKWKKQSSVWEHSGLPKPKKFKQTFPGRKLMATDFWGQKRCFAGGIHESRSNNHIRIVPWDITTIKKGDSTQMVWPTDFKCCGVAWQHTTPHCCAHTQLFRQFKWEFFKASAIQSGPVPLQLSLVLPPQNFPSIGWWGAEINGGKLAKTEINGGKIAKQTGGRGGDMKVGALLWSVLQFRWWLCRKIM
jgi:hypothetical protein